MFTVATDVKVIQVDVSSRFNVIFLNEVLFFIMNDCHTLNMFELY